MISRSDLNFLFCFIGVDSELIEVKKRGSKVEKTDSSAASFCFSSDHSAKTKTADAKDLNVPPTAKSGV